MHSYDWTPSDVVTIIAAVSALLVSVINALKNTKTQTRSDDNQQRINTIAQHLQSHDQQLTTLALNMPAPGAAAASAGGDGGDLIAPQPGQEDVPQ